jgi:hypothetical protein
LFKPVSDWKGGRGRGSKCKWEAESTVNRIQRNFFDRYVDKIKDFR